MVESIGEGVTEINVGDHVIPIFNGECQDCLFCKKPDTNMCEKFGINPMRKAMPRDGETRFWSKDRKTPIYHFLNTSTFSEYTVIDSACVVKIDTQLPLNKMTLLSCGISTGKRSFYLMQNCTIMLLLFLYGFFLSIFFTF